MEYTRAPNTASSPIWRRLVSIRARRLPDHTVRDGGGGDRADGGERAGDRRQRLVQGGVGPLAQFGGPIGRQGATQARLDQRPAAPGSCPMGGHGFLQGDVQAQGSQFGGHTRKTGGSLSTSTPSQSKITKSGRIVAA